MEIVVRSAITFGFLFLVMRGMGKKELAELSPFEMILLIVMGDIVQQGVTQEDMSLTGAFLAIGTMMLLVMAMSFISFRWPGSRRIIEGVPVVVIKDGKLIEKALRLERLAEDDVLDAARQRGLLTIDRVRLGILEPDGKFSFLGDTRADEEDDDGHLK